MEPEMQNLKVSVPGSDGLQPLPMKNRFFRHYDGGRELLKISAEGNWCNLLIELACTGEHEVYLRYEIRGEGEHGETKAYLSSSMDSTRCTELLSSYREFLESDPIHNLAIICPTRDVEVWLDEHNFIHFYGNLDWAAQMLRERGLKEGQFELPTPHIHSSYASSEEMQLEFLKHLIPAS